MPDEPYFLIWLSIFIFFKSYLSLFHTLISIKIRFLLSLCFTVKGFYNFDTYLIWLLCKYKRFHVVFFRTTLQRTKKLYSYLFQDFGYNFLQNLCCRENSSNFILFNLHFRVLFWPGILQVHLPTLMAFVITPKCRVQPQL